MAGPEPCGPTPPVPTQSPPSETPGVRLWPFVLGWLDTPVGRVPRVDTALGREDVLGGWRVRCGISRYGYRVAPGLYAVGVPMVESPVLVTANYKLTFDSLRKELRGIDAWLLVLDTRGINVWCAAGKGTFGTEEVVRRVQAAGLDRLVSHRTLILPQLGAPGVAAHDVRKGCGFSVVYGPVRASDLRRFFADGAVATPEMRRVTFTLWERLVLVPVEVANLGRPTLWIVPLLLLLGGIGPHFLSLSGIVRRGGGAVVAYVVAATVGSIVTPILLPWLPGRAFTVKGAIVGAVAAVLGILGFWSHLGWADRFALVPAVAVGASYCAMLFTGSTTFTSPSGVEREMRRALPYQLLGLGVAALIWVGSRFAGGGA
ncbi:MAG: carbon monoxide dehydrogenase [Deltaproteobacteria bacterium]|nr:carbon monoxide dehydrogenase [Deltaproteobacteria bacterium]